MSYCYGVPPSMHQGQLTMGRSPRSSVDVYRHGQYQERPNYLEVHHPYAHAMYMPTDPSDPNINAKLSNWQQRRPNLTLDASTQWSYAPTHNALPTPPMTGSPTTPRRSSQLSDTYANINPTTGTAVPIPALSTAGTSMASQILPPQTVHPQYHQYQGYQTPVPDPRYQYQPRPAYPPTPVTSQHFTDIYPPQGPVPVAMGFGAHQARTTVPFAGPMSLASSELTIPRLPKPSRRAKAHVAKACQNCKKAHLSCDEARPCDRCVKNNKQATCIDVEHKKRGRPRLREDKDARAGSSTAAAPFAPTAGPSLAAVTASGGLSRASSLREPPMQGGMRRAYGASEARPGTVTDLSYPARTESPQGPIPLVAFLSLDLRILKTNEAFSNVLCNGADARMRSVTDFVDPRHLPSINQLRESLRAERERREPTFLPHIYPEQQEQQAVDSVFEHDYERYTQGFEDRSDQWLCVLPSGQTEQMYSRVKLARSSAYFAVLTLRRVAQPVTRRPGIYRAGSAEPPQAQLAYPQAGPTLAEGPYYQQSYTTGVHTSDSTSPFASLSTLGTSLPPTSQPSLAASGAPFRGGEPAYSPPEQYAGTLLTAPMQPPPQPPMHRSPGAFEQQPAVPSESRPGSARERRRPDPLGPLQLPPIVSSAPTTPLHGEFVTAPPATAVQTPERTEGSASSQVGSAGPEDSARKRRRMDITDIVDQ